MLINGYTDLCISAPECHPDSLSVYANFRLDADISHLFPYLNAVVEDTTYYETPHGIIMVWEGVNYALYPDKATASAFASAEDAKQNIKRLIEFLNDLEDRRETLTPNHDKYRPPIPALNLFKHLPRTNCKKCDYPSCMAFAVALGNREVAPEQCQDMNAEDIARLKVMLG